MKAQLLIAHGLNIKAINATDLYQALWKIYWKCEITRKIPFTVEFISDNNNIKRLEHKFRCDFQLNANITMKNLEHSIKILHTPFLRIRIFPKRGSRCSNCLHTTSNSLSARKVCARRKRSHEIFICHHKHYSNEYLVISCLNLFKCGHWNLLLILFPPFLCSLLLYIFPVKMRTIFLSYHSQLWNKQSNSPIAITSPDIYIYKIIHGRNFLKKAPISMMSRWVYIFEIMRSICDIILKNRKRCGHIEDFRVQDFVFVC